MKLFNWETLDYDRIKKSEIKYVSIELPDGYYTMPYMQYYNKLRDIITEAINSNCTSDKPFYLEIVSNDPIDLDGIAVLIANAFITTMVDRNQPRQREYRLGAPNATYKINLSEIQIKFCTNFKTQTNIFGLEIRHKRKRKRII